MGIKAAVLGIGNLLLRDEGVGVHAVRELGERYALSGDVVLIDGGTMGLNLLPYIEDRDCLLILDAVDFGTSPGTIRAIEGDDIKAILGLKFSVHQIGLPDMLFAASLTDKAPPRICLLGIQPSIIDTGLSLSREVSEKLDEFVEAAAYILRKWGVEIKESSDVSCDSL